MVLPGAEQPLDLRRGEHLAVAEPVRNGEIEPLHARGCDGEAGFDRFQVAGAAALKPLLEPAGPAPTDCPDIVAMWSKKLEGDLSQSDCGAMEQHIKGCPTCGAACDALKTALGACRRVASGDVPPAVQRQVKAAMRAFVDGIRP